MSNLIELKNPTDGFVFTALHAASRAARRGGVIVLQEIFGLDRYVHEDAARWSELSFETLAPSLFDRRQRGYIGGRTPDDMQQGRKLAEAIPMATALGDVRACIDFLKARGPVFIVGYCYGGTLAWFAAGKLDNVAAISAYYGGRVAANANLKPHCPIILHFGRKDAHIPADQVKAELAQAQPGAPVYIYENSGHGFNNDGRPDSNLEDAKLARRRTLELFEANGAR